MAEINLLQPQKKSAMNLPRVSFSGVLPVWVLSGVLVLELAVWGGLFAYRKTVDAKNNDVQIQVDQVDQKISAKKKSLIPAVQAQAALTSFKDLLDKHLHWSLVWAELGRVTLKTVTYTGLSATTVDNKFLVDGVVPDYATLGKVLLGLSTSDNFEEVALVSTQPSEGEQLGVNFKISIKAKAGLFLLKAAAPAEKEQ
jgi:hypothetical protein